MTNPTPDLRLLGAFQLILNHRVVPVTIGSQRLITFLALHDQLLPRMYIAGVLWPEVPTGRANANLRAGLWRLPAPCRLVVEQSAQDLRLADIPVDLREATVLAQRLLDRTQDCAEGQLGSAARAELSADLLPTWYDDDWVLVERERFYQLRLHALEALCDRLITGGRYGEAIDAGLAAVTAEPLRESAHRVLIKAHLAEGNQGEADRQYQLCRHLPTRRTRCRAFQRLAHTVIEGPPSTRRLGHGMTFHTRPTFNHTRATTRSSSSVTAQPLAA